MAKKFQLTIKDAKTGIEESSVMTLECMGPCYSVWARQADFHHIEAVVGTECFRLELVED
jgi:hypothetical protein